MAGTDPYGLAWWNPYSWGDESEDEKWLEMLRRNAERRKQLLLDQARRGVIPAEQARREIGEEQSAIFGLRGDLELSRAEQDSEAQDTLVGFGDGLSFGLTRLIRWMIPGAFDEVDTGSSQYQVAYLAGTVTTVVLPAGATRSAATATTGAGASVGTRAATVNPNKLRHIFGNRRHGLDGVVRAAGSEAAAFSEIEAAAQAALSIGKLSRAKGHIEGVVTVRGVTISVRGVVVNGSFRLGTAYR
jgi:hypothetical protein